MTKAVLHPSLRQLSGAMGEMVFRTYNGRTVIGMRPHTSKEPTLAQTSQRENFKRAVGYAKSVLADEPARAFYEALSKQRDTPAFALSIADFLNAPSMDDLDLSEYKGRVGDRILITTHDDIGVVTVNVELTRTDGTNIERGQAVEMGAGSGYWVYTATAAVALGADIFIEAEGFDRPGNRTVSSANPKVGFEN